MIDNGSEYESDLFRMLNQRYAIWEDNDPETVRLLGHKMFYQLNIGGALIEYMLACGKAIENGDIAQDKLKQALFESGDLSDSVGFNGYDALVRETHRLYGDILAMDDREEGIMNARIRLFASVIKETLESFMSAMCHELDDHFENYPAHVAMKSLDAALVKMKSLANNTLLHVHERYGVDLDPASREADDDLYHNMVEDIDKRVKEFASKDGSSFGDVDGAIMKLAMVWSFVATEVNIGHADPAFIDSANGIMVEQGLPSDFISQLVIRDKDQLNSANKAKDLKEALMQVFGEDCSDMDKDQMVDRINENTQLSRGLVDELNRLLNDPNLGLSPSDLGL